MIIGAGQLPTDGVNSLSPDLTTGPNSPTNYAGETGSVDAGGEPVPSVSARGLTALILLIMTAGAILLSTTPWFG